MNIIIPVIDNNTSKFNMAKGFHTTDDVCVYNTLNNSYEWFKQKDISSFEENLSVSLKRRGIYTIITSQMPYMAFRLFKESGLVVCKSRGKSVEENIQLFLNDELEAFTPQLHFGTAYSACGSCSASSCGPDCN